MSQKEQIINALKKRPMKQLELSEELFGDKSDGPRLYNALMKLVDDGIVNRNGSHPSIYSLADKKYEFQIKSKEQKEKETINSIALQKISNESLEQVHQDVMNSENYGKENNLITECFKRFPKNDDVVIVAMKIGLIDITNSTHVSQHKSKISAVELAESIVKIKDIDERIKNGDPEVVNEIARCNGKINLFSFATKYCCYHNMNLYGKDDYSILDTVVKKSLPLYFDDISKYQIQKWQNNFQYKEYNDYITKKLDELKITVKFRKRKFDHFVWYINR